MSEAAVPAPAEVTPLVISDAQRMLNRQLALFNRMLKAHRRLVQVRSAIAAGPPPSAANEKPVAAETKSVAFFAGLELCVSADEAAMLAIELDVEDLAKLFGVPPAEEG